MDATFEIRHADFDRLLRLGWDDTLGERSAVVIDDADLDRRPANVHADEKGGMKLCLLHRHA
jgi:hypothetical protein